jgi:hypothetical protein
MKYPEHKKLNISTHKSQVIGEFLDWQRTKCRRLCFFDLTYDGYRPVNNTIEEILAEYFEIDLVKLEQEKKLILEKLRNQNAKEE